MTKYYDYLGREIKVGDVIAYSPTGRHAVLTIYEVLDFTPLRIRVQNVGGGRATLIEKEENAFILPYTATELRAARLGRGDTDRRKLGCENCGEPVTDLREGIALVGMTCMGCGAMYDPSDKPLPCNKPGCSKDLSHYGVCA